MDSPNVRIWINTLYNLQYCRSTQDRGFRSERQQIRLIHRFSRKATTIISCMIYQDMNDRVKKRSLSWCVALSLLPCLSSSNHLFRLHGHQPQQTGPDNPAYVHQLLQGIPHLWDLICAACPRSVPLPLSRWTCSKTPMASWPDVITTTDSSQPGGVAPLLWALLRCLSSSPSLSQTGPSPRLCWRLILAA